MTELDRVKKELANYTSPVLTKTLTNKQYHDKECPGVSSTFLKNIYLKSPLHAVESRENPPESPAMTLGLAVHALTLEPHQFEKQFAVMPEGMRHDQRVNAYKEFLLANQTKEVISQEEYIKVQSMRDSILKKFSDRLEKTCKEESIFFVEPTYQELCKVRPDAFDYENRIIYDIKTASDITTKRFQKSIDSLGYALQAAMYCIGCQEMFGGRWDQYYLVAVESSAPYDSRLFKLSPDYLAKGYNMFMQALCQYSECTKTNNWKGYDSDPVELIPWSML